MASAAKTGTKWGSFFEKAVAGVESRLDTILGEEDDTTKSGRQTPVSKLQADKTESTNGTVSVKTPDYPLTPGSNKKPDRLQERLAKALGGRNSPLSGSATPSLASTSPRNSLDKDVGRNGVEKVEESQSSAVAQGNGVDAHPEVVQLEDGENTEHQLEPLDAGNSPTTKSLANGSSTPRESLELDSNQVLRQQEVHGYLEQIESLRAKLQFLTQQAASDAKQRAANAEKGSVEQRLAEKDEKISLLLEEGSKLSQNELKLMTTIKNLRFKAAEDQKQLSKARLLEQQSEKTLKSLQEKLKGTESVGKDDTRSKIALDNVKKELDQAKSSIKAKDNEISELQKQVMQNAIASQETEKLRKELETERSTVRTLQEEISDAKLEKSLLDDRNKSRVKELEFKIDRSNQDAKAMELDLRREIQLMESRLETYRTKAEEMFSDTKGDVQAKLVRQIETLQSSYSVASENWRGIESSLMARLAVFENDLAEAQKKEAELRRKLRELGLKHKDAHSQVENARSEIEDLEEKLTKEMEKSKHASAAISKLEDELSNAQADLRSTKEVMEARLERLEGEKREAIQESLSLRTKNASSLKIEPSIGSSRRYPLSPGLSIPAGAAYSDRPQSRRASGQPFPSFVPHRQDSSTSISQSRKSSIPPTPTINTEDDDDFFANTPATPPERTIGDMVSTSTAGAGPSVQLVERMSAAVRRLESEKEATKDEIERLSAQRDEARNQVVKLMQEVQEKKASEEKTAALEKEIDMLNDKLQTTLEMLGEKSELVEELRADISDMKEIYKATLESTVR